MTGIMTQEKYEKINASQKIIKDFLVEMSSQDNRGTAFPYYYVIRDFKWINAANGCGEKVEYVNKDDPGFVITPKEYENMQNDDDTELDSAIYSQEDFYKAEMQQIEIEHGMFLTDSDAKNHLKINGHNYSNEAHTYVKHCFRTPALEEFFTALFAYFDVPIPAELYYKNKQKEK